MSGTSKARCGRFSTRGAKSNPFADAITGDGSAATACAHVAAEDRVDLGLIPRFALEKPDHVGIKPDRDGLLGLRHDEPCPFPECCVGGPRIGIALDAG